MNIHTTGKTSRREFLRYSAGALLALGIGPGCARFRDGGHGQSGFSFVVINDAHFSTPRCPEFYDRVREKVMSHRPRPEFCLFVGDLSDHGVTGELGQMRDILGGFKMPWHAVIGNHDYINDRNRTGWDEILPRSLNYSFEHRGWQIVGLDTTQGTKADKTTIQPHTVDWVKRAAPKLDAKKPTIIFSHFPLGPGAPKRPLNTDEVLAPFLEKNIIQVFGGHHHGFTEQSLRDITFVTNRCCSISRPNHDKTVEKGYFFCTAKEGMITREFIEVGRETLPQNSQSNKKA